jgi:hypothetical protein
MYACREVFKLSFLNEKHVPVCIFKNNYEHFLQFLTIHKHTLGNIM